jgi:hypothetical protein
LSELEAEVADRAGVERNQIEALRARLERRIRELSGDAEPSSIRPAEPVRSEESPAATPSSSATGA